MNKKVISVFLAATMVFSSAVSVFAQADGVQPSDKYLKYYFDDYIGSSGSKVNPTDFSVDNFSADAQYSIGDKDNIAPNGFNTAESKSSVKLYNAKAASTFKIRREPSAMPQNGMAEFYMMAAGNISGEASFQLNSDNSTYAQLIGFKTVDDKLMLATNGNTTNRPELTADKWYKVWLSYRMDTDNSGNAKARIIYYIFDASNDSLVYSGTADKTGNTDMKPKGFAFALKGTGASFWIDDFELYKTSDAAASVAAADKGGITISFDANMRTATLDGNIKLSSSDGTEIPCTVTASGYKTAVVAPQSGELAAGDYTVALTSSKTAATGIKTATGGYVTSGTTLTATVKDDSKTQANNVVFTANDGFELTALESGTITGKTSCKNDTGAAINPVLVLGLFKDGNLEDVKFESKPAAVDSTVELSTQIDVPENVDKTYKLVSYLWTGIDTLVPIADTKTLTTDGFELWTDIAYSKGDGGAYTTTYDVANYKPSTVGEVYVSASSGDDENNDGTGEKPFKTLEKALSSSKDSLTVHLAKGEYAVGGATPSGRNLALIGDEDGVVISTAASLDWSETGENSGIYKAVVASSANTANGSATSVIETVWDTKNADAYGDFKFMSKADSAALTDEGTFYYDSANSTLYVKPYGDSTTDDIRAYYAADNIEFSTANTLYMQNIDLEGGRVGCVRVQNNSAKLYAKDVTFKYAGYSANGGLTMTSGEAYLQNCTAAANVKDGFNYHKNTNGISKGVEINCIGRNNGFDGKNNNNGSTSHDGCMVFRFCGEYFNNQGPNVADVHDGTKTMNIGCKAYSSRATNNGYKYDYEAGQGAAKMWLTDCTAPNSESAYAGHVSGASESYAYSTFYLSGCNFSISGTGRKINLD